MYLALFVFISCCAAVHGLYDPLTKRVANKLNVHIIPHTHDDVGWNKNVDQYFAGLNQSIQQTDVRMLINQFTAGLEVNSERTFNYVEQAFFQRWWREQTEDRRARVKASVANGQLKFLNGGWCMHDEAATHYIDMIDQTTLGHRFIAEEFGISAIPTIGWQIDPFGHSGTHASLLSSLAGFDGLFFARIHYQDSANRLATKTMEMMWEGSPSLSTGASIFTGAFLASGYGPPSGFNFDVYSQDEPLQTDKRLHDYNVESRVNDFVNVMQNQYAAFGKGNDVMALMGSDFQWTAGMNYFDKLDDLIREVNKDGRINVFYSNPEAYVAAKASYGIDWTVKTDDFFPYASSPHAYWTGYFTSRPALKRYVRQVSGLYTAFRQIAVFGGHREPLEELAEAMGVAQHHDAVSGTSKQHTAFDYAQRIANGYTDAVSTLAPVMQQLSGGSAAFSHCIFLNVSVCEATQRPTGGKFSIVVWNSLAQSRVVTVRVPVSKCGVTVSHQGRILPSSCYAATASVTNYGPNPRGAPYEVSFGASLPAVGFASFVVTEGSTAELPKTTRVSDSVTLSNGHVSITVNPDHSFSMKDLASGLTTNVKNDWLYYTSFNPGSNTNCDNDNCQPSGAYIFRPDPSKSCGKPACSVGAPGPLKAITDTTGKVVAVEFDSGSWVKQRIQLPDSLTGAPYVEILYTVGSIPIDDGLGKEVVLRLDTDISSGSTFYTDSNGREMEKRVLNHMPTWNLTQTEPVAGNFYPVNAALYVKDSTRQFTVLTDASQSGSSLSPGSVELMAHRRILHDDHFGVGEPLNETQYINGYSDPNPGQRSGPGLIVRGRYRLFLSSLAAAASVFRPAMDDLYSDPVLFFSSSQPSKPASSFLAQALPPNVALVTMEAVNSTHTILRLGHQFGAGEDSKWSLPASVDLDALFGHSLMAYETTLTAQQSITRLSQRHQFKTPTGMQPTTPSSTEYKPVRQLGSGSNVITLHPLEIRTFLLTGF